MIRRLLESARARIDAELDRVETEAVKAEPVKVAALKSGTAATDGAGIAEPISARAEVQSPVRYGTRGRRLVSALVPAFAVVAGLGFAFAQGVFAVEFVAQSGTVQLTTDGLSGNDLGIAVVNVPTRNGTTGRSYNVRIGVGKGRINGLCISQHVGILGQPFTLLIRGGDKDPKTFEIQADGLLLDATNARGVIRAQGDVQVNKNGADVALGSSGINLNAAADSFGLQASVARLEDIVATVRTITVPNLLQVPNFSLQVVPGRQDCPPPGTGTGAGG